MAGIDFSGMSKATRERYLELRSREATGELNDFDYAELNLLRSEFRVSDN